MFTGVKCLPYVILGVIGLKGILERVYRFKNRRVNQLVLTLIEGSSDIVFYLF